MVLQKGYSESTGFNASLKTGFTRMNDDFLNSKTMECKFECGE
jgi:hypothetical protein